MITAPDISQTNLSQIVQRAIDYARQLRRAPESTYRLQLHKDFTFKHAIAIVPYLAAMGITHVYCSSYLAAVPGSTHGYDVIDHTRLNPEIGSEAEYAAFNDALNTAGLAHILDTVPNHVGVGTNGNRWWNDVLANGCDSDYGPYFDINWNPAGRSELAGKVLLPGLGASYGEAVAKGELKLVVDRDSSDGAITLSVQYYDRRFPISASSHETVLRGAADTQSVEAALARINNPQNADALHALLELQHYRLASWRVGPEEINYRRFFAINDLAALQMERRDVFEAAHSFILPKLADGTIAGLRIDHPDGLSDPLQYFRRLQSHYLLACAKYQFDGSAQDWETLRGPLLEEFERRVESDAFTRWPLYVVIEKILALGEVLPAPWPVDGTSGYDFLDMVNGLFVDGTAEQTMTAIYRDFIGLQMSYGELVFQNKKMVLRELLPSELHRLAAMLDRIAQRNRATRDFTFSGLAAALGDVIAAFPLYRTYITSPEISREDRTALAHAIDGAIKHAPTTPRDIFDFIHNTLLQKVAEPATDQDRDAAREFARRFQQLTAPATAKGIEDTTFYQYQRLISLNEVGFEPGKFGITGDELHTYLQTRAQRGPWALSTLSTHDTKRSEDVRARISVLADIPDQWKAAVAEWSTINAPLREEVGGLPSPARDEEFGLYQTLLGAWPVECEGAKPTAELIERVQAFMLKANREANVRTSWTRPTEPHESAVKAFIDGITSGRESSAFLSSFLPFQKKIAHFGRLNSLSQTLLKLTAPGAADTYQGTEMWDLSLVDPDNRRPVDYALRATSLQAVQSTQVETLFADLKNGLAKLYLHQRVLNLRRQHRGLFTTGTYTPLKVHGPAAKHVFAFARCTGALNAIAAVTRNLAKLTHFDPRVALDEVLWRETTVELPTAQRSTSMFTGVERDLPRTAPVFDLLSGLPVSLWIA